MPRGQAKYSMSRSMTVRYSESLQNGTSTWSNSPQANGRLLWIVVLTCFTGLIMPGVGRQKTVKRAPQSPSDPGAGEIGSTNT